MRSFVDRPRSPGRRRPARFTLLLLSLPLLGAGSCQWIAVGVPTTAGQLPVEIALPGSVDPDQVQVALDGVDVTASFGPGGQGLLGTVPAPDPGHFRVRVSWQHDFGPVSLPVSGGRRFKSPAAAPDLLFAQPGNGATMVARTEWPRLVFGAALDPAHATGWGFGLECDGQQLGRALHRRDDSAIVNPAPELPAGGHCRVAWRGSAGTVEEIAFDVAPDAAGPAASVLYDRTDPLQLAPFPDDFFIRNGSVRVRLPPFADALQVQVFAGLVVAGGQEDGFSRQPPIVVAFSHPLDPAAIPVDEFASIDPLAPISLIDVDPTSPDFGDRIPYQMSLRNDLAPDATQDHVALVFPSIDLRERGQYALVVSRRALADGEPGRPFTPSPFFVQAAGPAEAGESPRVARVRSIVGPVLATLEALSDVPIPVEDVALALSISVRTHPSVADLVHIKESRLAEAPPQLILPDPEIDPCPDPDSMCLSLSSERALEVRGQIMLPNYRNAIHEFEHDAITGLPVVTGVNTVPVRMSLPFQSLDGPVHPVMYQHGNPGTPDEIFFDLNQYLADGGFAVVGIQDSINREVGENFDAQVLAYFFNIILNRNVPMYWNQTVADKIGFLRAIQGMGSLDLLRQAENGDPEIGADGNPEIDPSKILYFGISEGGNSAERFLPFAPEILAAAPTVGGNRVAEQVIHMDGDGILATITDFLPQLRPSEFWVGLSLFQAGFDAQDGHTFLRHLYRQPLTPFAGSTDTSPPSILWTEGLGDTQLPNNATRAAAHELGIPLVRPAPAPLPTLPQVDSPLVDNFGPGLTAGYFQFDPSNTPSCVLIGEFDGHYCPIEGAEPQAQRLHFFETAISGAAEIINPVP